jgi:hypothetical protein
MLTSLQKNRERLAVETTVLMTVAHECHKLMPYSFAKLNAKFDTALQFNHLLLPCISSPNPPAVARVSPANGEISGC